jgi:DNA-binding MarR family transcriptional regulator
MKTARLPRVRKTAASARLFERHVPGIDYGVLDELTGYAIRRAQIAIYEEFDAQMTPLRITPPRFSSLVLIDRNPGLTQTQLAELIGVGRSGMVVLVDFFESEGWVRREAKEGDRRAYRLTLTAKGRAHLARAMDRIVALENRWTSRLAAAEKRALIALLEKVGPPPA